MKGVNWVKRQYWENIPGKRIADTSPEVGISQAVYWLRGEAGRGQASAVQRAQRGLTPCFSGWDFGC